MKTLGFFLGLFFMIITAFGCNSQKDNDKYIGRTFKDISDFSDFKQFKFIKGYSLSWSGESDLAYMRYLNNDSINMVLFVQKLNGSEGYKVLDLINLGKLDNQQGIGICRLNGEKKEVIVVHQYNLGDRVSKIIKAWEPDLKSYRINAIDTTSIKTIDSGDVF